MYLGIARNNYARVTSRDISHEEDEEEEATTIRGSSSLSPGFVQTDAENVCVCV